MTESHEGWRLKGLIYWSMKSFEKAREAFTQAIAYSSAPIPDYVSRGMVNVEMEEYAAAQMDVDSLMELDGHHVGGYYLSGILLFQAGEYRAAISKFAVVEEGAAKTYPRSSFFLSIAHLIEGDVKLAVVYARRYLELRPRDIEGRKLLAALYLQRENFDEIEFMLRPVLAYNPNDLAALNIRANALLQNGKADLALFVFDFIGKAHRDVVLEDLQMTSGMFTSPLALSAEEATARAFKPFPQFPREDILAILAMLKSDQKKEAVAAAESIVWRDIAEVAPLNVLAYVFVAIGDETGARDTFERALKREPNDPSANLGLAKLARKAKDLSQERAHYNVILSAQPSHLPTLISLAVLDGREGNNAGMKARLSEAIDRHPNAVEPRLGLARYYIDTGSSYRVESVFKPLQGLNKHNSRVRSLRYLALVRDDRFDEAMGLARGEHAMNPNTESLLDIVALHRSVGETEQLLDILRNWVKANPADVTARLMLARELDSTDINGASAQYREVIRSQPRNVLALNNLAWNLRKPDPKQALALIRSAAELAPEQAHVLDSLSVIEYLNGNYTEASAAIELAVWHAPGDLNIRYHQAMITAALGNTQKAIATLESMLGPGGPGFEKQKDAQALLHSLQGQTKHSAKSG